MSAGKQLSHESDSPDELHLNDRSSHGRCENDGVWVRSSTLLFHWRHKAVGTETMRIFLIGKRTGVECQASTKTRHATPSADPRRTLIGYNAASRTIFPMT
jgi:hypothetical protein